MSGMLEVFMALGEYDERHDAIPQIRDYRRSWLLLAIYSLARTTPLCRLHLMYCGLDNDFIAMCSSVTGCGREFLFHPEFISMDRAAELTHGKEVGNGLGTHGNLRLFIHEFHPEIESFVWLDYDVVVMSDLHGFEEAGKAAVTSGRSHFACVGDIGFGKPGANSGVMYCDAKGLREDEAACERLVRLCSTDVDDDSFLTKSGADQDIVNAIGYEQVFDRSWNCLFPDVPERPPDGAKLLHLTAIPKYALGPVSRMPGWSFLNSLSPDMVGLCPSLGTFNRKYLFTEVGEMRNRVRVDAHVVGRPSDDMFLQKPEDHRVIFIPDRVDMAFYISGLELARALETSASSYACNSTVPVDFHVMVTPGTVKPQDMDRLLKFFDALGQSYACTAEVVETPAIIMAQAIAAGEQLDSVVWRNNLIGDMMHDVFPDVDICVRADVDTVCVGDISELVGYCMSYGLGDDRHLFGLPNRWMLDYPERMAFGVSPQSFSMIRKSGFTDFLSKRMAYGRFLRADGEYSLAIQSGILKAGSYPMEWNAHTDIRRPLSSYSFTDFQDMDALYGKIPDSTPVPSPSYFKPIVYHFTGPPKPWVGKSFNQPVWDQYTRLAEAVLRSAK